MTELPTTTTDAQACCTQQCACAQTSPTPGSRLRAFLLSRPGLYLLLLLALYTSIAAYAGSRGASAGQLILGHGLPDAPQAPHGLAALTHVWFAAGSMLLGLMPYWIGGMLIAGALMGLAQWQRIARWFAKRRLGGSAIAAASGSAIPICSCGMAPLLGGLVRAGTPLAPAMAFVIAAPMINIPTVLVTAGALGAELAVARVIATLCIAMLAATIFGWWATRAGGPAALLRLDHQAQTDCDAARSTLQGSSPDAAPWWSRVLGSAGSLFLQMNGYLLLAVLLGGLVRALVPEAWIAGWVGGDGAMSVVLASAAASLLYLCTLTEVPTAAALVDLGMGPGATLAYLLVGPGVSLPSLILLSAIFRPRLLLAYAGFAFVCAVAAGISYNLLLG